MIDENKLVEAITFEIITNHIVAASKLKLHVAVTSAKAHLRTNTRTCVGVKKQVVQVLNALEELGYMITEN